VVMELSPEFQADPEALKMLYVRNREGQLIALNEVASISRTIGPSSVAHLGQLPAVTLSFDLAPGYSLGQALEQINQAAVEALPSTISTSFQGTAQAFESETEASVMLDVRLPVGGVYGDGPVEERTWTLTADDVQTLHELGWRSPINPVFFELDEKLLRTSNPLTAIAWGVEDTHNMMMKTYLTFVRLFQGTLKVDQLKGPVGIAHLGTLVAERGIMDLLFFLGLISVNLAVINFLPIPIADGGHFVMLLIERITGKPVSPAIQNIMALAGIAIIATVFVVVTYNDLANLFGG